VSGITEPAAGRYAQLPLATGQPVAFVDVKPGDRIQRGWQVFSHWESPEALQAVRKEIDRAQKLFAASQARYTAAVAALGRLRRAGMSTSPQELQDAEATVAVRQAEMNAAQTICDMTRQRYAAAEFEFNQAFVTSPIDGIVASVAVVPGERRQLSATFRGVTVLDLRVLQCRCLLSPAQVQKLDRLPGQHRWAWIGKATSAGLAATRGSGPLSAAAGAAFDRLHEGLTVTVEHGERTWPATITSIGIRFEEQNNRVPVLLEVENPEERLRCGLGVEVCFRAR
jgi:hypothetical protein